MAVSRVSKEYIVWRASVIKRDKRKCQFPGCKSRRRIQVHHILQWATTPGLRYEVSNGVALCSRCHGKIKGKELNYVGLFTEIVRQNSEKKR